MTKETISIGKQVAFDETGANGALLHLNKKTIPVINNAIREYCALQILKPFSVDVFKELCDTGGQSAKREYMEIARKDASKFKLPGMQGNTVALANEAVKPFLAAWGEVEQSLGYSTLMHHVYFGFDVIGLGDDLQPVIDVEAVNKHFTTCIESEAQAQLFEAGKDAERALTEMRRLLINAGVDISRVFWTGETGKAAIFDYDIPTGSLQFNHDAVKLV